MRCEPGAALLSTSFPPSSCSLPPPAPPRFCPLIGRFYRLGLSPNLKGPLPRRLGNRSWSRPCGLRGSCPEEAATVEVAVCPRPPGPWLSSWPGRSPGVLARLPGSYPEPTSPQGFAARVLGPPSISNTFQLRLPAMTPTTSSNSLPLQA